MRRIWRSIHWPLVALLAVGALVMGFVGFEGFYAVLGEPRSGWDLLYLSLQLFVLESGAVWGPVPWELQVARLLAPAVAGYAAVGALVILLRDQMERFRLRFYRNHVVICGLGRKGLFLARALREKRKRVVIIEEDADNDLVDTAREDGAVVLVGDARDPHLLRTARVHKSFHLVAVSGNDGVNAEVAVRARALLLGRRSTPLTCLVHIVDPGLCDLLRMQEVARRQEDAFRLDFFNVFEGGARALLSRFPVTGRSEGPAAHIVVVGLGRFGENLVLQAAREWRLGNGSSADPLQVTVVDEDAVSRTESLSARQPWLAQVCEVRAVDALLESREFAEARFLSDAQGRPAVSSIYICFDNDSRGISAALTLYRQVRDRGVPVVVRTVHGGGLASLLREGAGADTDLAQLHAFGLLDRTCNPDLLFAGANEALARAIHEEYVRDRVSKGDSPQRDQAMLPWEELDEDLKESNRAQAAHIGVKLAAVGCDLAPLVGWDADSFAFEPEELELLARMEHDRWVEDRLRSGWSLGPKDERRKTTPHLVPWEDLDELLRDRNRNTIRELPRFLARAGLRITRRPDGD
ncbi:MAG: NAD-binding protein [Longimicrobiales bacterium]